MGLDQNIDMPKTKKVSTKNLNIMPEECFDI